MAREVATIRLDIWSDDDFRSLTANAQHLYFLLLTHPGLSYCGVVDWRPGRVAQFSEEATHQTVMIAAGELSYRGYAVFDQGTEEVLVRSFLKWDGLLKQKRLAVSAAKAYGVVASNKIRAVIVHELNKLKKANPDWDAWEQPQMKTVLRQTSASVQEVEWELDMPLGLDFGSLSAHRSAQRSVSGAGGAQTSPTTSTSTSTSTPTSSREDAVGNGASYPQDLTTGGGRVGQSSRLADVS